MQMTQFASLRTEVIDLIQQYVRVMSSYDVDRCAAAKRVMVYGRQKLYLSETRQGIGAKQHALCDLDGPSLGA